MGVTLEEAVREVSFFIENGGLNVHNCEHVHRLVHKFGENADEVFQEASEQIRQLVAEGIVAEAALVAVQMQ